MTKLLIQRRLVLLLTSNLRVVVSHLFIFPRGGGYSCPLRNLSYSPQIIQHAKSYHTSATVKNYQLHSQIVSHSNSNNSLHPQFVTGLSDAEATFTFNFREISNSLVGWHIKPTFRISLHYKDKHLLTKIQDFFGVGNINLYPEAGVSMYTIGKLEDIINVIIPHFLNYPLITQKQADFILFTQIVEIINRGEHLTEEGLIKIFMIKKHHNKGLSAKAEQFLNSYLSNNPKFASEFVVTRPVIKITTPLDPNWVSSFIAGDGSFYVSVYEDKKRVNWQVRPALSVGLHSKDLDVLENLKLFFNSGNITKENKKPVAKFYIRDLSSICEKVIPHFKKYPLIGVKLYDFEDFCTIIDLKKTKAHLTEEGLAEIKKIVSTMNLRRADDKGEFAIIAKSSDTD
uniref:LAGLIDADG endonuclease n=1 Tax=Coniophora puteana TaxID=80637 RepID=A0A896Z6G7_9AGAM